MLSTMTTISLPASRPLRIGELAAQTGVSVEAIRYYEARGLLRPASRRQGGYREYAPEASRQVHFIKRAQALGFTLGEVKDLVRLREAAWAGDATRQLHDATVAKLADIDRRLRELSELRTEIGGLLAACDAACPSDGTLRPSVAEECPLVEALDHDQLSPMPGRRQKENQSPTRSSRSTRRGP
jgi:MerR family copper efflux transcriptional regulator